VSTSTVATNGPERDPVCGLPVGSEAPSLRHRNRTYRFCSDACRRRFQHDPGDYVEEAAGRSIGYGAARRDFWSAIGVAVLSNLLGAVGLNVYLYLVVGTWSFFQFPVLSSLFVVLGVAVGLAAAARALGGLLRHFVPAEPAEARGTDDALRVQALNAPVILSLVDFGLWLVLGSLMSLVYVYEGGIGHHRWFAHVFLGNLFAGSIVALDVFYITEAILARRVVPLLMGDRFVSELEGVLPVPVWLRVSLLVATTAVAPLMHVLVLYALGDAHGAVLVYFVVVVVGVVVFQGLFIMRSISLPIGRIADEFRRFRSGRPLKGTVTIHRGDKLGRFTEMFENLTEAIHERSFLQRTFGRYMSQQVLEEILDGNLDLGGTRHSATVLFCDIRDFTSLTENLEPEEVVRFLNRYFERMVRAVLERGGVPDKFIGDGLLAVWGVPAAMDHHARRAVEAARDMLRAVEDFNRTRKERDRPPIEVGIGLHSGELIAGNIGSPQKMEFTIIGDTVNTCSRIERQNKRLGSSLTISRDVYRQLDEEARAAFREVPGVSLRGKKEPLDLFTLRGDDA